MESNQVNPRVVDFLAASVPALDEVGRQAIVLDADVLHALNAVYKALDGRKPKRRIVNDLLRAALTSDALNDAMAIEEAA